MTNRVLSWYLFPSLLRNSRNKHQNNPLVSAEAVRHENTYIILYKLSDTNLNNIMVIGSNMNIPGGNNL